MKNLKYIKENCFICQGCGGIKVSPDDLMLSLAGEFKTCPMCDSRGHLNILHMEVIKDG